MLYQGSQLTSQNYRGRQARAEMLGITMKDDKLQFNPFKSELFRWLPPFSFQLRAMYDGVKELNEGNTYEAMLNFTSMPHNPGQQERLFQGDFSAIYSR